MCYEGNKGWSCGKHSDDLTFNKIFGENFSHLSKELWEDYNGKHFRQREHCMQRL